jgi:DNA-directed RNA polymerase specialized sigma24 family protein
MASISYGVNNNLTSGRWRCSDPTHSGIAPGRDLDQHCRGPVVDEPTGPGRFPGSSSMAETDSNEPLEGRFPSTHWSRVVEASDPASPHAREALSALCQAYWYPLYAFIRRRGHNADETLDLTQEYFARLLEKGVLAAADQAKGRFRNFLMADCVHFLLHQRESSAAQKRGGGQPALSIDADAAEGRFGREPADQLTPEHLFERAWAMTLLDGVLGQLRADYQNDGRGELFDRLKVVLTDGPGAVAYAVIAADLKTTEGAVQVAVHRLRRRYAALLRQEIAATIGDEAEVDDEIRALFTALAP